MYLLRTLVIVSSLIAIIYDLVWLKDPVGVFWETPLVLVNVAQLAYSWFLSKIIRFSEEEKAFLSSQLPGLTRTEGRKLLNQGLWITGDAGITLTTQGVAVQQLIYLYSFA